MNFKELLIKAQNGDTKAQEELLTIYNPLLIKESIVNGFFDENLYQELCYKFLCCIQRFKFNIWFIKFF